MRRRHHIPMVLVALLATSACTTARLEYDRMTGTVFPQPATRNGTNYTLGTIYVQGSILLAVIEDDTAIAPLTGPANPADPNQYDYITEAEIDTVTMANRSSPVNGREWPCGWWIFNGTCREYNVWGLVANHFAENDDGTRDTGALGLMIDSALRSGFVNYYRNTTVNSDNPRYLRSTAHEIGHSFNLNHCDGDGSTTIMNQTGTITADWVFEFSAASLDHLQNHVKTAVWPGIGARNYACPHVH